MLRERSHDPREGANRPPMTYLPGSPAPVVAWLPPCGGRAGCHLPRKEEKQVLFKRKAMALAAGLASVAAAVVIVPTAAQAVPATIPLVFQNNHNFNEWQTGLTFLGIFVGMAAGVLCDPLWRRNCENPQSQRLRETSDTTIDLRLVRNNGSVSEPEFRLPPTIL